MLEKVVRANQFREGMELVEYAEVGLPIFRLTIEAVSLARKPVPTIDEFVMRTIRIGETSVESIARFLGLDVALVSASARLLRIGGLIASTGESLSDASAHILTELGKQRLAEGAQYEPQEEMLVVDFDGIRRAPIWLGSETVSRASDLADAGALEIRPYPAGPPEVEDLRISEIASVIRRQAGNQMARDILALKRIVRRANVFRRALLLVFRSSISKEVQFGFLVGDRTADDYELQFAARGGPKKMGLVRQIQDTENVARLRRMLGQEIWAKLAAPRVVMERRLELSEAQKSVDSLKLRADAQGGVDRLGARELKQLALAEDQLSKAQGQLDEFVLRGLAPYEQRELLFYALKNARERILISSSGLDGRIVDSYFLRDLDLAIERGVRVTIATRRNARPGEAESAFAGDPFPELVARTRRSLHLTVCHLRRAEELYCLVQDNEFALLTNKSVLGESRRRPSLVCVNGIASKATVVVNKVAEIFESMLDQARSE